MKIKCGDIIELAYNNINTDWFYIQDINYNKNMMRIIPFVFGKWELLHKINLLTYNKYMYFLLQFPKEIYDERLLAIWYILNCNTQKKLDIIYHVDKITHKKIKNKIKNFYKNPKNYKETELEVNIINEFVII